MCNATSHAESLRQSKLRLWLISVVTLMKKMKTPVQKSEKWIKLSCLGPGRLPLGKKESLEADLVALFGDETVP
ncbi:hypothetical protein D0O09_32680 [Pseudomonas putida]|nr:hypothetical protein D0O09_32680 [Pseudomonas putida]